MPKVAWYVEYLADDVSEDEAEAEVGERGQEERPEGRDILGSECWDHAGEDQCRQADVHRHLRGTLGRLCGEEALAAEEPSYKDGNEAGERQWALELRLQIERTFSRVA